MIIARIVRALGQPRENPSMYFKSIAQATSNSNDEIEPSHGPWYPFLDAPKSGQFKL
jgi:hypothetical protein